MKRIILALPALLMLAGCFHEDAGKLDSQAEIIPFEIRCISGDVTDLTHESVTFNGWVSVDGFQEGARVEAGFYYSPTEDNLIDLKTKGKYVPAGVLPSSGGGFKAEIIGLEASTRYYYISQAQSSGSQVFGNVRSFTTEDVPKNLCVTGDVLDLSEFSVRLVGHVYPKEDTGAFSYGLEWSCKDNLSDSTRVACSVLDENNTYYATLDTLDTDADYFYRAFVKCGEEYVYGETKSFHTFPVTGSVTTEQVSDITEFKALLNGKMEMETIAQTQRRAWFFLGEDPELTIRDSLAADLSRDGTISFRVDTLSYGKTYYCRAFGAVNYGECFERILSGEIVRFSTTDISPELKTLETEDITEFKATLRGFLAPGNLEPLDISVWFVYGTDPAHLDRRSDAELQEDGSFHYRLNQLNYAERYYYKACCRVYDREFSADVLSFETLDINAQVTTLPATSITEFSAILEASLTEVSNDSFSKEVWFYYGNSDFSLKELIDNGRKVQSSLSPDGSFMVSLSALDYGVSYSYVACARVYDKVFFGEISTFITRDIDADVSTGEAISITEFAAKLTGSLVDRSDDRFNKGFYFYYSNTASDVATLKNLGKKVKANYLGDGQFEAQVDGLVPGEQYCYLACFRVYDAEFNGGIRHFTTMPVTAVVTAPGPSEISYHKVTLKGVLEFMSNPSLDKEVWFLWADNPASASWNKVDAKLKEGSFTSEVSDLESGKTYYYKAVARIHGHEFMSDTKAFCTRIPPEGSVDLGLSVCWASCNYGAAKPSDAGCYLTWEEAIAAATSTGLSLPTYAIFDELRKNCIWQRTIQDSISGYLVTGKNGNSIFIPEAGHYSSGIFVAEDSGLWSSQTRTNTPTIAFFLRFNASMSEMATANTSSAQHTVRFVYE